MAKLEQFTNRYESRPIMHKPWNFNGIQFATNGHIIAVIQGENPSYHQYVNENPFLEKVLEKIRTATPKQALYLTEELDIRDAIKKNPHWAVGDNLVILLRNKEVCFACHGSAFADEEDCPYCADSDDSEDCIKCDGLQVIYKPSDNYCTACHGLGSIYNSLMPCNGIMVNDICIDQNYLALIADLPNLKFSTHLIESGNCPPYLVYQSDSISGLIMGIESH